MEKEIKEPKWIEKILSIKRKRGRPRKSKPSVDTIANENSIKA